jgi:hypothetical protein
MDIQPSTPQAIGDSLLRSQQVADRLGVTERWVRDHATRRSPKIPVVKLGSLLRFRPADIDAFVDGQLDDHSGTKHRR